tara:strand:+ start:3954 stop:4082 length:129 start_codon:yes stop_codon:yes gene_type:complete
MGKGADVVSGDRGAPGADARTTTGQTPHRTDDMKTRWDVAGA